MITFYNIIIMMDLKWTLLNEQTSAGEFVLVKYGFSGSKQGQEGSGDTLHHQLP